MSLEIVPPNTSRGLAAVLDAVFKNNSKQNEDDGKGLEDAEADLDELPASQAAQSNTVNIISFYLRTCLNFSNANLGLSCSYWVSAYSMRALCPDKKDLQGSCGRSMRVLQTFETEVLK